MMPAKSEIPMEGPGFKNVFQVQDGVARPTAEPGEVETRKGREKAEAGTGATERLVGWLLEEVILHCHLHGMTGLKLHA